MMPIGDKFLNKRFIKPSFETQVSEIVKKTPEIKQESEPSGELLIDKKEYETKAKKKTATDIHTEIKQILDDSPDLNGHERAYSVLLQAFKDGYKGKRLDSWQRYLVEYFQNLKELIVGE